VAPLARRVNEVAGESGRVILVGHSMGGLVCRAYSAPGRRRAIAPDRYARHARTTAALAPIGHGADALDMRPWRSGSADSPCPSRPACRCR
jgi:alpha-beta hydrolase superfamily lysophospholipase